MHIHIVLSIDRGGPHDSRREAPYRRSIPPCHHYPLTRRCRRAESPAKATQQRAKQPSSTAHTTAAGCPASDARAFICPSCVCWGEDGSGYRRFPCYRGVTFTQDGPRRVEAGMMMLIGDGLPKIVPKCTSTETVGQSINQSIDRPIKAGRDIHPSIDCLYDARFHGRLGTPLGCILECACAHVGGC